MTTFTISLPDTVAAQLESEIKNKGFATRSEFIRTLLRRHFAGEFSLEVFQPKPIEEVRLELAKTGKYSEKFIESVTHGLAKSSVYGN